MERTDVRLVSVTPNAEAMILYIVRVSSKQDNPDTKLIGYLIRNGHWSPFEHASMTLEINTSRAISQQIIRHRSFTFQEFSQRYSEVAEEPLFTECRVKAGETNRQGSVVTLDIHLQNWWHTAQTEVFALCKGFYEEALNQGIAPEVARMILPLASSTKVYMTGNLRSWIHYLGDGPGGRTNPHTQHEHREIALEGQKIFCKQFPIISEYLGWL